MLISTIKLAGAIVIVVSVAIAAVLEWLQRLEKYPTVQKFVEAKALRTALLIVAIVLLFGVFQDIDAVREALNISPPSPKPPIVNVGPEPLSAPIVRTASPPIKSLPPVSPFPATQTNNAPNGIAIGGGTVTNPTVNNFAPVERHLAPEQIQSLALVAASLPVNSASWLTVETINMPESSNLASEIKKAFGDRAYGVVTRLVEDATPVPKGVFVIVSGNDSEHFDSAQQIANALGKSVFLTIFQRATGLTSKQVKVVVESD